ncbi:MAG TPA: hypothetical protein VIW95_02890, partial [Candidatus Binatus sp.]|uniref:hypothetical protein n=1 Tax=Candidatus Binatus sp. TaxID=2811406 RepID=UPI002F4011F3
MKNPAATCRITLFFLIALCAPPSTVPTHAQPVQSQPPPSVAELIKGLQSPNPANREQAAKAAAATKPLSSAVVP